jgi:hypothetical protein
MKFCGFGQDGGTEDGRCFVLFKGRVRISLEKGEKIRKNGALYIVHRVAFRDANDAVLEFWEQQTHT